MILPGRFRAALAALMVLGLPFAAGAEPPCCRIAGHVRAIRTHTVYVMLWQARDFLAKPVAVVRLAPDAPPDFAFTAPPGAWAVSAFEDVNENGKLDMSWFGPTEPYVFARPFHAPRKPRFGEVSFQVDHDLTGIDLAIGS